MTPMTPQYRFQLDVEEKPEGTTVHWTVSQSNYEEPLLQVCVQMDVERANSVAALCDEITKRMVEAATPQRAPRQEDEEAATSQRAEQQEDEG